MMQQTTNFICCCCCRRFQILISSHSQVINSSYSLCSQLSYSCGSTGFTISYPFLVDSRPNYCGYSGYHLNCTVITVNKNSSEILTITINNNDYRVHSINYTNNLLNIAHADFIKGSCPEAYTNNSNDTTLSQNSDRDHKHNLTLYINCTSPYSLLPGLTDTGCLTGIGGQRSYYNLDNMPNYELILRCSSATVVPLSKETTDNLVNGNLGFGQVLQQGFFVKWTEGMD